MRNKSFVRLSLAFVALMTLSLLFIFGCKDEAEPPILDTPDPVVDEYLVTLPSWGDFCPLLENKDEEFDPSQEFDCENKFIQTTTPCSITRTPEDIVTYDAASEILYLGSLIQGEGYMGGLGSIQQLPIYQRAPLSISISFSSSDNSRIVENPSLTTVNQAIGELVEVAQNSGLVSGSSIFFKQVITHSVEHTALALGLSAKYMGASVKSKLEWENTSESTTVSAYFVQKMFTTSMSLPQRPMDVFSNDFTKAILDEQIDLGRIGPDNLPVYVSAIVWGRMMLLTMTSSFDETSMKAALSASYNGIEGEVSAEHLEVLEESEIEVVTIGGNASDAQALLVSGSLGDFFKSDAPLTSAVPISYTLRNLSDNQVAKVSEVTSYNRVEYDSISVMYYGSEENWRDDAQYSGMTLKEWDLNDQSLYLANESATFEYYSSNGQTFLGNHITYSGDSTGFPFDFYLENVAVSASTPGSEYALVYNDQEGFSYGAISIGDIDNFQNDDFEIGVTGTNVYAFGFYVEDNEAEAQEFLEVYAADGLQDCYIDQINDPINNFVGLISPVPLKRIWFNEGSGGDDIAVKNFTFGVKQK